MGKIKQYGHRSFVGMDLNIRNPSESIKQKDRTIYNIHYQRLKTCEITYINIQYYFK